MLDLTGRLKRNPDPFRNRLTGRRIGMIFDKPSTRTRVSFESAAWMLGMLPIVLRPDELQLGRGGDDRRYRRVEAVVDKDHAAVVLAEAVDADTLLLLTDVTAVQPGWVPRIGFRSCT